jgi:hypothetical protein
MPATKRASLKIPSSMTVIEAPPSGEGFTLTKYPSECYRENGGDEAVIALLMRQLGMTREQAMAEMDKHGF